MITEVLASHIASANARPLPREVEEKTMLHILDTVAAMISGTQLAAAKKIVPFVQAMEGKREALVIGTTTLTTALHAALANGMLAHADETDDSHAPSLTHPGCAVVPAALAVAEREHRSGLEFLRAVAAGYDVGPRISAALGAGRLFDRHHSSHSIGGLFGAAAAACSLLHCTPQGASHALAYAVQLASGNTCWRRDPDHVEKAFDFAGMPAHNGVFAALMAGAGFTGVPDALEGTPGLFAAFPDVAEPALATAALGQRYEVMQTAIKKWCVGSPIQAALDSLEALLSEHRFSADELARITVALPKQSAPVVDNRDMPAVNLQFQLALLLTDGRLSFSSSHDLQRMSEPGLLGLRSRIHIDARPEDDFIRHPRQAVVSVELTDGRRLEKRTVHVRGTPDNPMTMAEVVAKARDLMAPVLGQTKSDQLIDKLCTIQEMHDIAGLRSLLSR